MKNRFKHPLNYVAVQIAIISFALGTVCLLLFKTSGDSGFVGIGYCYTLLAAFTNTILLLLVLVNTIRHYRDYPEHLSTMFIVLANIPITFFYLNLL